MSSTTKTAQISVGNSCRLIARSRDGLTLVSVLLVSTCIWPAGTGVGAAGSNSTAAVTSNDASGTLAVNAASTQAAAFVVNATSTQTAAPMAFTNSTPSNASMGNAFNVTACAPGFVCVAWVGPIATGAADAVPSIVVTLLFMGACAGAAVGTAMLANLIYNRYTTPKPPPPSDDDYDEDAVKESLLTRLGVMSWKPDPVKPEEKFAKRAVMTWLRRATKVRDVSAIRPVVETGVKSADLHRSGLNVPIITVTNSSSLPNELPPLA